MPAAAHSSQTAFYTDENVGNKSDPDGKFVIIDLSAIGGPRKCVFWLKWVVWLKDGAFLRR